MFDLILMDWYKFGSMTFLFKQPNMADGPACFCRLARTGLFHPLL